jgi:A/G-specific adenine glycosylase
MLQQTQVATVIPYYRRFLGTFPSVAHLARAPLERVLEVWSGLGYYRRARNLHRAARALARRFGGQFPRHYSEARSLPGVGDYTARAILSIAYNLPYAVLDGNVARVVARLRAFEGNLSQPRFRRAVERELDRLLSRRRPGNFNQALMELGQTVCLPRAPRCGMCPVRRWCRAYRAGKPETYPAPRPRRAAELRHLAAAVLSRPADGSANHFKKGRAPVEPLEVLLVRGLDEGLLGDLWNFPAAFGRSRADALLRLRQKLAATVRGRSHLGKPIAELRHGITYRTIRVEVYGAALARVNGKPDRRGSARWFPLARLPHAAVSQLARKIAARL